MPPRDDSGGGFRGVGPPKQFLVPFVSSPLGARRLAVLSISILGGLACLRGAEDSSVGVILSAESATIQPRGVESEFAAAAGRALQAGDIVRTGTGTVRFVFCPDHTVRTLQPNREFTVPAARLPNASGLFGDVQNLPSCELPRFGVGEASDLLATPSQSSGPKADILETIQRASAMVRRGQQEEASMEYMRLASDYPNAVWARPRGMGRNEGAAAGNPGGKTFALLIGISKYPPEQPLGSLQFARADAQTFADFLLSPKGGSVPGNQIQLLLDERATRDRIDSAVKDFVNKAAGNTNTLILYIAAHGDFLVTVTDPKTGKMRGEQPYLVTADTDHQDEKTTGYPMADFRTLIAKETQAFGRVIVYADVCHAGFIRDAPSEKGLEPAVKEVFSEGQGNVGVMLASARNKFAYEAPQFGNHGAFTYSVLKGLNGGAAHKTDPVITFADLFRYVVSGVGELTNNTQSPDKFVNDDQMAVLDDVTKNPGIRLPNATPLPEAATRRRRAVCTLR
jgi:uncharacterized caspase-like protein